MQAVNGVRVCALIKTSFFQRRTNENSSIAAGHKVQLGSADNMTQHVMPCAGYGQHLSLDRPGREAMSGECTRPGPGAIYHARRAVVCPICADASDSTIREEHVVCGVAGRDVYAPVFGGL